ncbi:DEAD/DEAH box helicase [Engelhardtia mirabilis]|uniref:Putative ATP-dependent helicase Lhr n=1 Tax=Engelhardtia mirabilis TaxID=2528011 RepID=A0A518BDM4_9BACT|nr:putative ATP-dependent helicase Lhr [Planctomycetes bacterium Pla133]QDU99400.1 putative ATP-dependent helicase Lhr [Planctomycetes bacterium Pla86]
MDAFGPATRAWFRANFAGPTPVQSEGWAAIGRGEHALLLAPTGSGKTLAAFLWALDRLAHDPRPKDAGVRVLYVSPLKALAHDVERNLRAPLAGLARSAGEVGAALQTPTVGLRTGDTPPKERERLRRDPPQILVTTPESLYLMLGSRMREVLRTVETVIVDEVHALVPSKRGTHLALSLERLVAITHADPQRIGLSATARPTTLVAAFLGGDRPVTVIDTSQAPAIDVRVVVPVADMERPAAPASAEPVDEASGSAPFDEPGGSVLVALARRRSGQRIEGLWPALHARILTTIDAHRTTIVFVNSRGLCERLANSLNDLHAERVRTERGEDPFDEERRSAVEDLVLPHHGSLSRERRSQTEELLKTGAIRGIVATSSLELGIDMAAVDHVTMVEAPASVTSALQRIGRAGHGVGEVSVGTLLPKHRGDLLQCALLRGRMVAGAVEPLDLPRNPLDVLAQQIVATVATEPLTVDELEAVVRRAAPYRELGRELLAGVLDMLSGRYPSQDFAELRPRLNWNRDTGELTPRGGAKAIALTSGGTIPDRGLYPVRLGPDGPRVGELDEEMVHETRPGHVIALGASSWRVSEISRDRVVVEPAPGEVGRLPFWRGDGPGRPIELGIELGAFLRRMERRAESDLCAELERDHSLDAFAAANLARYLAEQSEATGALPTDRRIVVERFRDEVGDWRLCVLSPFGKRVHAPWGLAIEHALRSAGAAEAQAVWSDDGIVLRLGDADELPDVDLLLPDPDTLEQVVIEALGASALFAGAFRENAARALLLPRRRPGERAPLWLQRLKAQNLLEVAREYPAFPIVLETYRTCLQDVFDLGATESLLRRIRAREVAVHEVETQSASPFARSLVFAFTEAFLYQSDAPLAERRAQALTLDRELLRQLLGADDLRELLDAEAIDGLESELQGLADGWRARSADDLHDLLRRVGDLTADEVAARCEADPRPWLEELRAAWRAIEVTIAGSARWIAAEDAAALRDGLGVVLPVGLPTAWLEPVAAPLGALVARFARSRGPFRTRDLCEHWGLSPSRAGAALTDLENAERLASGGFRPGGEGPEWIDAEVLRRIKQRSLARLRREVAPVERSTFARFLDAWHGLGGARRASAGLAQCLDQLEGLPLSLADLEGRILPARMAGFSLRDVDDLLGRGEFVWIGHGALGAKDGQITLHRRERVELLLDPPPAEPADLSSAAQGVHDTLTRRGACFYTELVNANRDLAPAELDEALWELVWRGLATNDTLEPVRRRGRAGASASRRCARSTVGGRWSLVRGFFFEAPGATERAHARALTLLERQGVVTREGVMAEATPGGFAAAYPVLREMEDAGKVRRGYFVDGLGGAQFAFPGAVDRLRAARRPAAEPNVRVLAACDPAQPFGASLPWPELRGPERGLVRRAAGTLVVLVDGELALFVGKGGRQLATSILVEEVEPDRKGRGDLAFAALYRASTGRGRRFRIDRIDGDEARVFAQLEALRAAGFTLDGRSLYAYL